MLVEHSKQSFRQLIDSLPLRVHLTEEMQQTLRTERGAMQTNIYELRSASRFRCFGDCMVTISAESYCMPGQDPTSRAIVRDLSRKGLGLLAHQQWYPEQILNLQLENASIQARVARARLLVPFCYEIGLVIVHHNLSDETSHT